MYSYVTEKPSIFTESGQVMFLEIRDRVQRLLKQSGAVRMEEAIRGTTGNSWQMLACVDRLVELGEIREIYEINTLGQYRIFVGFDAH